MTRQIHDSGVSFKELVRSNASESCVYLDMDHSKERWWQIEMEHSKERWWQISGLKQKCSRQTLWEQCGTSLFISYDTERIPEHEVNYEQASVPWCPWEASRGGGCLGLRHKWRTLWGPFCPLGVKACAEPSPKVGWMLCWFGKAGSQVRCLGLPMSPFVIWG